MRKINIKFYQIFLLVILFWMALSLHKYSCNGRYKQTSRMMIFDTRTGDTYISTSDSMTAKLIFKGVE